MMRFYHTTHSTSQKLPQTGNQATVACGNTQICTGKRVGIEGNLHTVRAIWPQSSGWTIDNDGDLVEDKLYS